MSPKTSSCPVFPQPLTKYHLSACTKPTPGRGLRKCPPHHHHCDQVLPRGWSTRVGMEAAEVAGESRGSQERCCRRTVVWGEARGRQLWGRREPPALRDMARAAGPLAQLRVRAGQGGPRTHAGKGEGAEAWQAARASRGGMAGSSHSLGRWCGGGSDSGAAGRGQHSGPRGRGTGSGLSRLRLPAPRGPRALGGGDWPPRWPSGPLGPGKSPSRALPTPLARQACATVTSRALRWPRQQTGPGLGVLGCKSAG